MRITVKEVFLQFLAVGIGVMAVHYGTKVLWQSDFYNCFYRAGLGLFDDPITTDGSPGWIYKDWLYVFFIPLTWFRVETAYLLYSVVSILAYMTLIHLVMEKKYGFFIVLATLPLYKQLLQNSNPQLLFALLVCFPLPTLFTVLFKPHYSLFALIHAFGRGGRQDRLGTDTETAEFNTAITDILPFRRQR